VRAANVDDQGLVRFSFSGCLHRRSFDWSNGPSQFRAARKLASDCAYAAGDVNRFARAAEENSEPWPAASASGNSETEGRDKDFDADQVGVTELPLFEPLLERGLSFKRFLLRQTAHKGKG